MAEILCEVVRAWLLLFFCLFFDSADRVRVITGDENFCEMFFD